MPGMSRCVRRHWAACTSFGISNGACVSPNLPPIKHVCLRLTPPATLAVAFGSEPQTIAIAANPAAAVEARAIATSARLPFELVEQDVVAHCPIVHRVTFYVWERRLSDFLRHGRYERR